ncbi:MAG: hypothetical protein QXT63_05285 [Thermoplasmata archaeon]
MMPTHCKQVSVRRVNFPLTVESIRSYLIGKKAFTQTSYVVIFSGKEVATAEVIKEDGLELFRKILDVKNITLPSETVYVEDENIDLLNRSFASRLCEKYPGKTVVIKGEGEHISFVRDEHAVEVAVVDTVPPKPGRLFTLVEHAQRYLLRTAIKTKELEINLQNIAEDAEKKGEKRIMFPCRASCVNAKNALFLDECKNHDKIEEILLIGCSLSYRIFEDIYKQPPARFINICPREYAKGLGMKSLARCCKVKSGYEIEGDVATVPWGARLDDVAAALKALVGEKEDSQVRNRNR